MGPSGSRVKVECPVQDLSASAAASAARIARNILFELGCEPGSKLLILGMVIQPLLGNPYNG